MKNLLYLLFVLPLLFSCGSDANIDIEKLPPDQLEFFSQRHEAFKKYNDTDNSIKKSKIYNDTRAFCCQFASKYGYSFQNWVGIIDNIYTDRGADYVRVEISVNPYDDVCDIEFDSQRIAMNTELYNKIAELNEGQEVKFDFSFNKAVDVLKASINDKCYAESNNNPITAELNFLMSAEYPITLKDIH